MSGLSFEKIGLGKMINELKRYKAPQELLDEIMSRLCDIGVTAIQEAYADGNTGESLASVHKRKEGSKWVIAAQSDGLLFLEFGAGVTRNPDGALHARSELGNIDTGGVEIVGIGEYGKGQGSNPSWYAPPIHAYTTGTKSRHGFADAITAIYANTDSVIKEVLSKR